MAIEKIDDVDVVDYVDELVDWRKKRLFEAAEAEFLGEFRKIISYERVPPVVRYGIYLTDDMENGIGSYVVDMLRNGVFVCQGGYLNRAISLAKRCNESGLGVFFVKRHDELSNFSGEDEKSLNELEELIEGEEE
jgi:hypothetical protein